MLNNPFGHHVDEAIITMKYDEPKNLQQLLEHFWNSTQFCNVPIICNIRLIARLKSGSKTQENIHN